VKLSPFQILLVYLAGFVVGLLVSSVDGQTTQPARDAAGFSTFLLAPGARDIYVATSGNDANPGTPAAPLATLAKAVSLLRGSDHLLLKAGDTFPGPVPNIGASGAPGFPTVISAYGSGPRPVVKVTDPARAAIGIDGRAPFHDLAVVGIDFYAASRDPDAPEFAPASLNADGIVGRVLATGGAHGTVRNITVEDCVIRWFRMGFEFDGCDGLAFRRNIVTDCYGTKSQGLYLDNCDNFAIEGNVFDRCGYSDHPRLNGAFPRVILNHAVYVQSDCGPGIVTGNVFSRPSSHGCQLRGGGTLSGNAFIDCPIAGFVGQTASVMSGNLVVGGGDIGNQPRGWGLQVNNCPAAVADNLVVNKRAGVGPGWAYEVYNDTGRPCVVTWSNNAAYNWPAVPSVISNPQQTPGAFVLNPGDFPADAAVPVSFVASLRGRARGAWDDTLTPAALLASIRARVIPPPPTKAELKAATDDVAKSLGKLNDLVGRMK
jgi:hypothetical protein